MFERFRRKSKRPSPNVIVPVDPATLGFTVGDIVADTWGSEHMVTGVDPLAEHGLGIIRTRRLSDGVILGTSMFAHDLKFVRKGTDENQSGHS